MKRYSKDGNFNLIFLIYPRRQIPQEHVKHTRNTIFIGVCLSGRTVSSPKVRTRSFQDNSTLIHIMFEQDERDLVSAQEWINSSWKFFLRPSIMQYLRSPVGFLCLQPSTRSASRAKTWRSSSPACRTTQSTCDRTVSETPLEGDTPHQMQPKTLQDQNDVTFQNQLQWTFKSLCSNNY